MKNGAWARWMALALILAAALLLAGRAPGLTAARTAQFGSTPPPGPLLGTGDYITTSNGHTIATWEEYPGGTLYIWLSQSELFRALAGSCAGSSTAVCYTWIWYVDNLADPYNQDLWTPVQRGCMVLGADPLTVGEADGFAKETDVWAAGETYIPVLQTADGEGTLNPAATGVAPAPSGWDPTSYDQCFSGALGSGGGGGSGCLQWNVTGTWQVTQQGGYTPTFTLQQSGTAVTGTLTFSDSDRDRAGLSVNSYAVAGTLTGAQLDLIVTGATRRDGRSVRSEYTGTVSDTSISAGTVTDLANGGSRGWSATGSATCASGGSTSGGGGSPASVSGVWDANNGVWTFSQSGGTVTGSIQFSGGLGSANLQGTISSGVIQANWQCNSDCQIPSGGTITLTLSSDGCSMQGSYVSVVNGATTGTGPLTMTRRNCGR